MWKCGELSLLLIPIRRRIEKKELWPMRRKRPDEPAGVFWLHFGGCVHERGGAGVLIIVHGRRRMIIDRRIPKMPGRSTSGFHRPGRYR